MACACIDCNTIHTLFQQQLYCFQELFWGSFPQVCSCCPVN